MRWIFHLVRPEELVWTDGRYAPSSLAREGFLHASYRGAVRESAALYFAANERDALKVLAIDTRLLDVPIEIAETPRGPMPHVVGSIPLACVRVLDLATFDAVPDEE
jgi:uncharacterized protein (DUF952 family)